MTYHRYLAALAVLVGLAFGFAIGFSPAAEASRNSSGTYSLPSGSTVTTGTTITSTWANTLTSDLASELTNSLDRQGRGAMTAPLQCSSGTAAAPGLTFSADPDSGMYRVGAGNLALSADSTQVLSWTSTTVTAPKGLTATQSTTNSPGITATGNGTSAGVNATGGSSAGSGVTGTGGASSGTGVTGIGGSTNGTGVNGLGTGSGYGGNFTGGSSNGHGLVSAGQGTGDGIQATGGASDGEGVKGIGGGSGAGGYFVSGTAATGGTRKTAVLVEAGDIVFTSTANPSTTTAIGNSVTPKNIVKAWARITTDGASGVTLSDGFNVSSAAVAGAGNDYVDVTFASAFTSTNYACVGSMAAGGSGEFLELAPQSTTVVRVNAYSVTAAGIRALDSSARTFSVVCLGAQ